MSDETIYKGNIVAVALKPGSAPLRCYIGQVQVVDDRGLRITCMDWLAGAFTGFDVFVPWPQITAAHVATEEHSLSHGGIDHFIRWQERMNNAETGPACSNAESGADPTMPETEVEASAGT